MTTPKRPYFLRALHEWLTDNEFTPYLMVDATHTDVVAPLEYAQEGRLVLAISYQATHELLIDNDAISFKGRFGGVSQEVWIPMAAVMGVYAKEDTTHALFFDPSEYANVSQTTKKDSTSLEKNASTPKKSGLKILK
ncbi:MAG: ClpXP protease specificity-enhancing factor [Moraxella sp.]|nr:ClpXP protease specificity-enhancing factor [Moraxella sp.]